MWTQDVTIDTQIARASNSVINMIMCDARPNTSESGDFSHSTPTACGHATGASMQLSLATPELFPLFYANVDAIFPPKFPPFGDGMMQKNLSFCLRWFGTDVMVQQRRDMVVRFFGVSFHSLHSLILARMLHVFVSPVPYPKKPAGKEGKTYSLSRKSWYSSSPTLTGEPPNCANTTSASMAPGFFSLFLFVFATTSQHIVVSSHGPLGVPKAGLTVGIKTRSPACTPMGTRLPSLSIPPGPTASTLASFSSLTLDSGRKMPEAVLASALMRWTRTRSRRGTRDLIDRIEVAYCKQKKKARSSMEDLLPTFHDYVSRPADEIRGD